MSPEVNLTKLSADDDASLDRAVSAYLEFISGCSSVGDDPKKELASYVAGMGTYYSSDVFAIYTSDEELSSGLMTICSNGNGEITIEDFFVSKDVRNQGIGRAAVEALASEYPDVRAIELYSLKSAEGFYQRIGFDQISPSTKKCLSLWRKELD